MGGLWVAKGTTFLQTEMLGSGQTDGMLRMILIFVLRRWQLVPYDGYPRE